MAIIIKSKKKKARSTVNAKEVIASIKEEDYEIKSPIKAIRANCIDCCGGSVNEVKLCQLTDCPMHPFRFGKNPFNKRTLTPEQKIAYAERMKKVREARKNG